MKLLLSFGLLSVLFRVAVAGPAPVAAPRYFIMLGAVEPRERTGRPLVDCRQTHSDAYFVKAALPDGGRTVTLLETFPLSWMPCDGVVDVDVFPKRLVKFGCNYPLIGTLNWVRSRGLRRMQFHPIEIRRDLYEMAKSTVRQLRPYAAWLEHSTPYPSPSRWEWAALDRAERIKDDYAKSCHHMITDIVAPVAGLLKTKADCGYPAIIAAARWLSRWFIQRSPSPFFDDYPAVTAAVVAAEAGQAGVRPEQYSAEFLRLRR